METKIIKNTIEAKIAQAIKSRIEKTFKIRMAVETKHGREVRETEIKGILLAFDEKTGNCEIMKTGNGMGEVVTISLYEINEIE